MAEVVHQVSHYAKPSFLRKKMLGYRFPHFDLQDKTNTFTVESSTFVQEIGGKF